MIKLKMEYLGLLVDIQCGEENGDMHVNNRALLSKIEDFLDQLHLYENVNVRITSDRMEDNQSSFTDTLIVGDMNDNT